MERGQAIAQGRFAAEDIIQRYAEGIDMGDIETVGALFARGEIVMPDGTALRGTTEVYEHYANLIIFYDGDSNVVPYERGACTPRTRHITTNLICEFNNAVNQVDVRSCFSVYQNLNEKNEIVAGGRYVDRFELDLQGWHITRREIFLDHPGDMSRHLKAPLQ